MTTFITVTPFMSMVISVDIFLNVGQSVGAGMSERLGAGMSEQLGAGMSERLRHWTTKHESYCPVHVHSL